MSNQTKLETVYESAAETAKKIRQALKANFPGVKFSVRSKTFAGGDSVYISWTDLPLTEEVEKITSKFESGSFDGMQDMYISSGYIMNGKRYVGAKYISCSRNKSTEYTAQIENWMKEHYGELNVNSWEYNRYLNRAEKEMIEEAKTVTEQPEEIEVLEVIENELIETNENKEVISLTVELDNEKGHIRLFFSLKPSENVREILKGAGFRWYKTYWGAKQNKARFTIVEAIQTILNDTNTEELENDSNEVVEEMNTQEIHITADVETPQENSLIGRKVFGQWGVMSGWDYGTIINESEFDITIQWEEGNKQETEICNLVHVNEYTNLDAIGIYLLPIEEQVIQEETTEQQTPKKVYVSVFFENDNKDCFLISSDNVATHEDTIEEITFRYPNSPITAYQIGSGEKVEIVAEQEESNLYNNEVKETVNGFYCHFKAWNYEVEQITEMLNAQNIPFYEFGEKFMFNGITKEQFEVVQQINKENASILFDDSFDCERAEQQPENENTPITEPEETSGKVLDFTSRFQQKKEKEEQQEAMDFFTSQVLPYLSFEDKMKLYTAQEDKETFNSLMFDLMVKAKKERLKTK